MNDHSPRVALPPFPPDYRASGVLLHVASLPSPYGIGDVGPAALAWVDRLREAGQSWWQALPLGPTGVWQLALSVQAPHPRKGLEQLLRRSTVVV
jgi:4-alpha-glucanotransferase